MPRLLQLAAVLLLAFSHVNAADRPRQGGGGAGAGQAIPLVIKAARVLDGRGRLMTNVVVTVQGTKIVAVGPAGRDTPPVSYDLGDATLLPGLIDVHVHIDWRFQPNGLYGVRPGQPRETPEQAAAAIQKNLDDTLRAGFTTIQTLGNRGDGALRDEIAAGARTGPRIVTSLGQLQAGSRTPDELREQVRQYRASGADVIKTFASGSIRDGGRMNVTQAQLDAICGEAKAQGLRAVVHAHDPESILATVRAGCFQVEHGVFADDAAIQAMKAAGVYFDPNIGLVLQNYLENKDRFLGSGNYTEEGFAFMERAVPTLGPVFAKALRAGVRMPLGTDAVAGAHGQNAREILARVAAGQSAMDAIVSATSLAAETLRLGDRIGAIAPGYEADLIAVPGNPLTDISALGRVSFVMKGGRTYKD